MAAGPPRPQLEPELLFFTGFGGKFQFLLFILDLPFIMMAVGSPCCCNENQEKHNNSKGNVKMLFKIRCVKHYS